MAVLALAVVGTWPAHAAEGGEFHLDGRQFHVGWVLPFSGLLLSIALMPLVAPRMWHRFYGIITALWALAFLLPFAFYYGPELALFESLHVILLEYLPFVILLGSLYVVTGGVRLKGYLAGTPVVNTGILALGTALASFMGTTGAAMLLIRPLISANQWRTKRTHIIVFFIFLVANVGGSLTPLGDPPLFMGFLNGVPFFWVTHHMLLPMLLTSCVLLVVFYLLDSYHYRREKLPTPRPGPSGESLSLEGGYNLLLVALIALAVLIRGAWSSGRSFEIYHVSVSLQEAVSVLAMVAVAGLSTLLTSWQSRFRWGFTWFPIVEVAKIFGGIFITVIPVIAILRAGEDGVLAPLIGLVSHQGEPVDAAYFWMTGVLSSFLDNAPTYLIFFNTAGGDAGVLTTTYASTLLAISAGSVFMGAYTYIGNAPNFMVRSIAQGAGISMPSFLGYTLWSVLILTPVMILVTVVFFL